MKTHSDIFAAAAKDAKPVTVELAPEIVAAIEAMPASDGVQTLSDKLHAALIEMLMQNNAPFIGEDGEWKYPAELSPLLKEAHGIYWPRHVREQRSAVKDMQGPDDGIPF